ncbi:helix-turn-helix transcriptional regulator [Pseudomonas protegens]|uniref:helix-turn-helix transcriptional regulator n=1 Tax=Pseudomonas protegens TaxID=380021 RepID=UPI002936F84E|nr:helix-turn-helix transcriptional regulator [Pseudomonas protegens]WOE81571.1 helix-turn-helix transcriptional regulator [Pseudomonas protegens]
MNKISTLRGSGRIRQTALAEVLMWSQSRLSNYESGARVPGLSECRAITAALNQLGVACTLDDVFPPELDVPRAA